MSPSQPIRVMLVDDHTMVRRGLATFLKVFDDLELAGEADSGEAAVQLCGQVLPDVILMASGSEVEIIVRAAGELLKEEMAVRLVDLCGDLSVPGGRRLDVELEILALPHIPDRPVAQRVERLGHGGPLRIEH